MPGKEKNAKKIRALLAAAVFLLCGCGAKEEAAQTAPSAPLTEETAAAASPQGPAAEKVQSLLAPYEELLNQASCYNRQDKRQKNAPYLALCQIKCLFTVHHSPFLPPNPVFL